MIHRDMTDLYSLDDELFERYIKVGKDTQKTMREDNDSPRYSVKEYSKDSFYRMVEKYSNLPSGITDPNSVISKMTRDLYIGVPRWNSPRLQYNVGTAVNEAAAAAYALALDQNIYNINDGLAGNSLVAEEAVVNILSKLAKLEQRAYGIFTFGGTATNMYGMKLGLKKANPRSSQDGLDGRVKVFVTEDAHFSHAASADWLGIGTENVVTIKAKRDRTSDITDLEIQLRKAISSGFVLGTIIINGGTTYDHAIDDIKEVIQLRNRLVEEFQLAYKPHVHVDTVIGWIWLFFQDYSWSSNPLELSTEAIEHIKYQYDKISNLRYADSWGIDFHKSIGGCPIDSSMIMINKFEDAMYLSRKASSNIDVHQLAEEYSFASPVEYTLETSRAAGAPLAALTALQTLGVEGYQRNLSNLIEQTIYLRKKLDQAQGVQLTNKISKGFVTILRFIPPEMKAVSFSEEFSGTDDSSKKLSDTISKYTKAFFDWDYNSRVKQDVGPEFSYSSGYMTMKSGAKLGVIKIYPVSPFFTKNYADEIVSTIAERKEYYDKNVWKRRNR